jgi:hypothetical protein
MDEAKQSFHQEPIRFEERKQHFFTGMITHDLRGDLPPGIISLIENGEEFNWFIPGKYEPLRVIAQGTTAGKTLMTQDGYWGAIAVGLIESGHPSSEFAKRDVVTILSEPHGSVLFGYDRETGKRFWPQGDVSDLNCRIGNRTAEVSQLLDSLGS